MRYELFFVSSGPVTSPQVAFEHYFEPRSHYKINHGVARYENPDTGDTGVFIQYFECRDLLVEGEPLDDVVLTFDMGIEEASYEDALPVWEDILASIEWDVESGSADDDPTPDDNGSSAEGVDGNVYIDPQYLWMVEWDEDVLTGENWIVDEDEGPIGVQIFGEAGNFLTIFATKGTSIRSCTNTQIDITEGSAFTDFVEVEDIDLPETSDDIRAIRCTQQCP